MKITYKLYSDIGSRENNEDSLGMLERDGAYCFALADGLGGHGKGEVASAMAVKTVLKRFEEMPESGDFLDVAFTDAQDEVLLAQRDGHELADMKTTMVVLQLTPEAARWGHIGDSRLYFFQNGKLKSHTPDHSVPQMLVNIGEISEKEIRFHEDRNRLLRVIGAEWGSHSYDLAPEVTLRAEQVFLLCSDGFWELIEEKQMMKELKRASSVEEWMDAMTGIIRDRKDQDDMDNNSAIAVWITK